jgi:hypothetical protein
MCLVQVGAQATFQLLKRGRTTILPQCAGTGALLGRPAASSDGSSSTTTTTATTATSATATTTASGGGASDSQPPHPLRVNRYAKFATADSKAAMGLWAGAASELAAYAAQVTAEGGMDAAQVGVPRALLDLMFPHAP